MIAIHLAKASNFDEIIDYVIDSYSRTESWDAVAGAAMDTRSAGGRVHLNENEAAALISTRKHTPFFPSSPSYPSPAHRAGEEGADGHMIADICRPDDIFSEEFIYWKLTLDAPAGSGRHGLLTARSAVAAQDEKYRIQKEKREQHHSVRKAVQDFLESYLVCAIA